MATQSRSIYTQKELAQIAKEMGLGDPQPPSSPLAKVSEAMDTAITEATEAAAAASATVVTAGRKVPAWLWPLIVGYVLGVATFFLARIG